MPKIILTDQVVDPGIALIPVCIRWVVATTASLNHCFTIGSYWEQLGSKLIAHQHQGLAPAASCFESTQTKNPWSWVWLCLDCRDVWKCFSGLSNSNSVKKKQQRTTLARSIQKFKKCITQQNFTWWIRTGINLIQICTQKCKGTFWHRFWHWTVNRVCISPGALFFLFYKNSPKTCYSYWSDTVCVY